MANATQDGIKHLMEEIIAQSWPQTFPSLQTPFPVVSYDYAMKNYGVDKPDTRFQWLVEPSLNLIFFFLGFLFSEWPPISFYLTFKESISFLLFFFLPQNKREHLDFIFKGSHLHPVTPNLCNIKKNSETKQVFHFVFRFQTYPA